MIRYGIVGFGLHAVKRMVPGFRGGQNSKLVALSRRDRSQARESALQYDVPLAFDSVEELCRHPEVDAVFVATPNVCHLNDVLTAARHGKAILCEKPMAMNADECRQMVEATRSAGVKFGVAQVFRFEDSVRHIQQCIASGDLGETVLARAEFAYPGRNHARKWINDRASGGGVVADVGVHCIDALRYMLNDEVTRVQALTRSDAESGEVDAAGALVLQFSRGTLATIMVTMRAEYQTPVEVVGEAGVLTATNAFTVDAPLTIDIRRGGKIAESWQFRNANAYARMLDSFSDWVEGREEFVAPGEEGWRNQLIIDAAYESARSGCAVTLG
ncbi:MAG TPA: Gfo/Idh/MocA family oxidoreductase [Terriglobales bacterium]|nr:Gfo/Idh/MocA family oxidoreductase [Terriglobales bacterium]